MKKLIIAASAVFAALILAGCSPSNSSSPGATESQTNNMSTNGAATNAP